MFRSKNDRHHLVVLFANSATLGKHKSFAFYARACQALKNFTFSTWSVLISDFQGAQRIKL